MRTSRNLRLCAARFATQCEAPNGGLIFAALLLSFVGLYLLHLTSQSSAPDTKRLVYFGNVVLQFVQNFFQAARLFLTCRKPRACLHLLIIAHFFHVAAQMSRVFFTEKSALLAPLAFLDLNVLQASFDKRQAIDRSPSNVCCEFKG